jgi:hypothetical protein
MNWTARDRLVLVAFSQIRLLPFHVENSPSLRNPLTRYGTGLSFCDGPTRSAAFFALALDSGALSPSCSGCDGRNARCASCLVTARLEHRSQVAVRRRHITHGRRRSCENLRSCLRHETASTFTIHHRPTLRRAAPLANLQRTSRDPPKLDFS